MRDKKGRQIVTKSNGPLNFLPCILVSHIYSHTLISNSVLIPENRDVSFPNQTRPSFLSQKNQRLFLRENLQSRRATLLRRRTNPTPPCPTASSSLTLPRFPGTPPSNRHLSAKLSLPQVPRDFPLPGPCLSPFHRPDALTLSCKRVNRFLEAGQGGRKRRARETWPVSRPGRPPPSPLQSLLSLSFCFSPSTQVILSSFFSLFLRA